MVKPLPYSQPHTIGCITVKTINVPMANTLVARNRELPV